MKEYLISLIQDKERVQAYRRIFAYVIDAYIVALLCNMPILYFKSIKYHVVDMNTSLAGLTTNEALIMVCISICLSLFYLVVLPKKTGQTLGKRLMRLEVISLNGGQLSYIQLIKRAMIGMILIEGILFTSSVLIQEYVMKITSLKSNVFHICFVITIVSIIYSLLNKKQMMFHDCIAKTRVVKKIRV